MFFHPQPAPAAGAAIDRLAVVSWNMHEGGGDVDALIAQLRAGRFTDGPIDHFVLLLQEATRRDASVPARVPHGSPVPRRILTRSGVGVPRFADEGFAVLYAPSMRNGDRAAPGGAEDRGNAIVSTVPLADARLIELPLERQRRVAVAAAVEGRTGNGVPWRLDLVDVHLDTALALWHDGPFAARRRQADALIHALARSHSAVDDRPVVLAGDLNTWMGDREAAVRVLNEAFSDTPPADHAPTWRGPGGLHAVLDHMFVRGAVSASAIVRVPDRFGSDHYPLLTIIRF